MEAEFRTYCGLAGDLQELLLVRSELGIEESILISRSGLFRLFKMRRAKKKLLHKLELITGKRHYESKLN